MDATVPALDLSPLRPLAAACRRLRDAGWQITDGVGSVAVRRAGTADVAGALTELADLLPTAINVEAVGERGGARLRMRLVHGALAVVDSPPGDVRTLFDDPADQGNAREAFEGDADAALALPLAWTVEGTFDFARVLAVPAGVRAAVAIAPATVVDYVTDTTAQTVERLAAPGAVRVLAAADAPGTVRIGGMVLAGPGGEGTTAVPLVAPVLLDGETAGPGNSPPAGVLVPAPGTAVPPVWQAAARHAQALACQLVWKALATASTGTGHAPSVTFHGYKKTSFALPAPGAWTPQQITETLALRRWALHDASPDRLLAVRQVVSLYDDGSAALHAADVQASAEIVYTGLRTDAVAEAVKGAREAHGQAQDAARQAAKNAHDLLKGATERMLAALVAVGAVLVANAGRTLPDETGRLLLLLVAAFLLVLAAASVAFEGPLLSLPAKNLKDDLHHQPGLLTQAQRDRVDATPSLKDARRRVRLVRFVVPIAHTAFAVLIYAFGHPSRYTG
jgi:hypothetical protein